MRPFLVMFLSALLIGHTTDRGEDFRRYYSSIDVIDLPVVFDCLKDIKYADMSKVDPALFERFHPQPANLVGRVFPSEKFVSIIYLFPTDSGTPVLFTYSKDGRPIDTLGLYLGGCQSDPGGSQHSFTSIRPDRTIRFIDSVFNVRRIR